MGKPRVTVVSPEPTPYRAPLFDRLAQSEIDLTVLYAAQTVADRRWSVALNHPAVFLRGVGVPGVRRLFRHDYPITPGVWKALGRIQPDLVVASGWSTFASQAAVAWCRRHHVPYVLIVESHDEDPRPGWRRTIKKAVVPRITTHAAGALVTGTLAARSMRRWGVPSERIWVFANTIDVTAWASLADALRSTRAEHRTQLGIGDDEVAVLAVCRLVPEKRLDTLISAVGAADGAPLHLVIAGSGPEESAIRELAERRNVRLTLAGEVDWQHLPSLYVAADVFALLSDHEPWGVVVNEAAACGLPLILSDRVGAAADLLVDGENGALVPVDNAAAAAQALSELAGDPAARRRAGSRSREIVASWSYEASVANFTRAVDTVLQDHY